MPAGLHPGRSSPPARPPRRGGVDDRLRQGPRLRARARRRNGASRARRPHGEAPHALQRKPGRSWE